MQKSMQYINEPYYKLWAIMITNGSNKNNTPGVVGGSEEGISVVVIAEWEGRGKEGRRDNSRRNHYQVIDYFKNNPTPRKHTLQLY